MKFQNGMIFGIGAGLITAALDGLAGGASRQSIYMLFAMGVLLVVVEVGRHMSFKRSGKPSHKVQRPLS